MADGGADGARRLVRGAAWAVLAAAALYTLERAWRLQLDYYDAFIYLYNASRFIGDRIGPALDDRRPWLLPLLQAPAIVLCRLGGPGSVWLLRGPHLLDAALSLGAVAALIALLRRPFGTTLALVGGALFAAGATFLHYSANAMTDLGVMGLSALTLLLHLGAASSRRLGRFALAGVAFGLAMAMKFTAPLVVTAILATEAASLVEVRPAEGGRVRLGLRLDPRRRLGLVVEGLVTAATFAVVELGALARFYGTGAWAAFRTAGGSLVTLYAGLKGEPWTNNLPLLVGTFSTPVLVLAAGGALAILARPRRADVPFVAWLLGVGAGLFFTVAHYEARYLFLLAPAVIYFAVRGVEAALALGRRAGPRAARVAGVGVALLACATLAKGGAQAWADGDPLLTRDLHARAARGLAARPEGAAPYTIGTWVTLAPDSPGPMPEDQYWNAFNATAFVTSYLLGEATLPLPGAGPPSAVRDALHARLVDGGRVVRFDGSYFDTHSFVPAPRHQGLEVWTVERHDLALAAGGAKDGVRRFVEPRPTGAAPAALELRLDGGRASLTGVPPGGPWWIYTRTPKRPWAFAGESTSASATVDLPTLDAGEIDAVDLMHVDVERFE